jgi:hypothetical protein
MTQTSRRKSPLSVLPLPTYVTFSEAAAWLAVSTTTLTRYVRELEGFPQPFYLVGTTVRRFRKSELEEFFKKLEDARPGQQRARAE